MFVRAILPFVGLVFFGCAAQVTTEASSHATDSSGSVTGLAGGGGTGGSEQGGAAGNQTSAGGTAGAGGGSAGQAGSENQTTSGSTGGSGGSSNQPLTIVVSSFDPGFKRSCVNPDDLNSPQHWGHWKDANKDYWWFFTNGDTVDCSADWYLQAPVGTYQLKLIFWSYCDQPMNKIGYVIHHQNGVDTVMVDQFVDGSWTQRTVDLGTYSLTPDSYVEVTDATGNPTGSFVNCPGGAVYLNVNLDTVLAIEVNP